MTYRDPDDPRTYTNPDMGYRESSDPMRRTYNDPARLGAGNTGSIIGALVVIVLIAAAIAYATNRSSTTTASGPSTTQSTPSTTGQGGPAGAAPTGTAR
jgi:hypothetical protein